MPVVALILALEILASSLLVSLPTRQAKSERVLGQSVLLAENETPPPDQTAPADQTAPPDQTTTPTDQTPPPSDTTNSQPASAPTEPAPTDTTTTTPAETPPTTTETTSPQPESSPAGTTQTTENPTSSPEASAAPQETPEQGASASADLPILNTDESINNTSQIDVGSQTEVTREDQQLNQITDPTLKAAALITFASDKISDIDHFTKNEDFASTTFASQRLSDQIDQLKSLSAQVTTDQQIRQKLSDLCQQTNVVLRTSQETVPEDLEQDLEITRGQCLGY